MALQRNFVVAIAAALLYYYLVTLAFAYVPLFFLRPTLLHAAQDAGGQSLLRAMFVLWDILILFVVSLPFAILFARLYRNRWMFVAVSTSCAIFVVSHIGIWRVWNEAALDTWYWIYTLLNSVFLLAMLPALTYLAHQVSKNSGSKAPWHSPI